MIIAIDGPAGAGKSTVAREVAKRLGMRYLDTGAMYRAVTLLALEAGLVPDRIGEVGALAARARLRVVEQDNDLSRVFVGEREISEEIRGPLVSQHVSLVSADPAVRAVLTQRQREEAALGNVVLEGRDMGTVVAPQADVKVFLTASVEERARRRQAQLQAKGVNSSLEQLVREIEARDAYDSSRVVAPLRKADDAVEIDTTSMTIDEVVNAICALAEAKCGKCVERCGDFTSSQSLNSQSTNSRPTSSQSTEPAKWRLCGMIKGPMDTLLYRVAYAFVPELWRFVFRMKIEGVENVPLTGPVVLACNHRSNLDPFFLGSACPRMVHFMAKAELWKVKALGKLVEWMGGFPVRRGEADRQAVRRAFAILDAGGVLGVFPEGRRHRDLARGPLGDIQPGISLFSLYDDVVTIPVVMEGTEKVAVGRRLAFPQVRVAFGPPLELPDKSLPRSERASETVRRLREAMLALVSSPVTAGGQRSDG